MGNELGQHYCANGWVWRPYPILLCSLCTPGMYVTGYKAARNAAPADPGAPSAEAVTAASRGRNNLGIWVNAVERKPDTTRMTLVMREGDDPGDYFFAQYKHDKGWWHCLGHVLWWADVNPPEGERR